MIRAVRKAFLFCSLFSVLFLQNTHALDIEITEKDVETFVSGEFNRSFMNWDLSAVGNVELNNLVLVRAGFSVGIATGHTDIRLFTGARVSPFTKIPLSFALSYLYNGLPQYKAHSHTLMPIIAFDAARGGGSIGPSLRFTTFYGDPAVFESIMCFSGYFNIINNGNMRFAISVGNYGDFRVKNVGAYSLGLNSAIRINEQWHILNDFDLMQSGGDGLTTTFYGFVWRTGMRFSW